MLQSLPRYLRRLRGLARRGAARALRPRAAIVSCITDNFIGLGAAFLQSLVETGSIPKGCDVVLLTCPVYAPLSEENRARLRAILPGLVFETVETGFLSDDLVRRWVGGKVVKANIDAGLPGKRSVYLKLHILRMTRYGAILWLDSDMMALRSIAPLFHLPADLCMVPAGPPGHGFGLDYGPGGRRGFNSGLMLVRERYIAPAWFDRAVALLNEKTHTDVQDQSLLNHMWREEPKLWLPHGYNWKVPKDASPAFHRRAMADALLIHFVAHAKWHLAQDDRSLPLHAHFHALREKAGAPLVIGR